MLVRMSTWEEMRDTFSEEEKKVLNANVVGEIICPRGLVVRVCESTRPLLVKLGLEPSEEDDE